MATYLYKCTRCHMVFERDFPMGEAPSRVKDECSYPGPGAFGQPIGHTEDEEVTAFRVFTAPNLKLNQRRFS